MADFLAVLEVSKGSSGIYFDSDLGLQCSAGRRASQKPAERRVFCPCMFRGRTPCACYDPRRLRTGASLAARVAKLVYARDLKSLTLAGMRVRPPPRAPATSTCLFRWAVCG